ncbi:hypothetical protein C8N43_1484 [Litoreibacter ponti]|uniref:Uncharacterized protein n=1 Tax=Litoreibacter ponti TaxID=1510457 RepID=A0A2T6BL90_9RHOB|nr:hypothetical protein [Litoreibacter ponti]PTX56819.1 hypothetical protein C8N43_1484 [Litoreibacter ponti]
MATTTEEHIQINLYVPPRSLLATEIQWMAFYSPHLDFSLALHEVEQEENATRLFQDQGACA